MSTGHALIVAHNIEVAHRLSQLPGKCEAIHGHSMWVALTLDGPLSPAGMVANLDFGLVKKAFRAHLDAEYDHRLLLNAEDAWAGLDLPGLHRTPGDPTTEHIAKWIGDWARYAFPEVASLTVQVDETRVNAATYSWMEDV